MRRGLFISLTLVRSALLANLKPNVTKAVLIAMSNRLFTFMALRPIMFNAASGDCAIPFSDIGPDPATNAGRDVPNIPSAAIFPTASDWAIPRSDMSLERRLLGADLLRLLRAM